jgi:uncharacterized membrane protein (UPF0127 family)
MLRASLKKIKSAPDTPLLAVLAGGAILVGVIAVLLTARTSVGTGNRHRQLRTAHQTYGLEVVSTAADQEKGLGDRSGMPKDTGMLFEFPAEDDRCFWMKDMHFSLDIIWVDAAKRITRLEHDLSPATYPRQYCSRAQYVIELNAGEAARNNLRQGTRLDF